MGSQALSSVFFSIIYIDTFSETNRILSFLKYQFGRRLFHFSLFKTTSRKIDFSKRKNLLLIYVESLERRMGNVSLVGKDAIAPIKKFDGLEITSFPAAPGTNWTIAGMLSRQCSIPLKPFFPISLATSPLTIFSQTPPA